MESKNEVDTSRNTVYNKEIFQKNEIENQQQEKSQRRIPRVKFQIINQEYTPPKFEESKIEEDPNINNDSFGYKTARNSISQMTKARRFTEGYRELKVQNSIQ